ncbi:MAG TPA: hypothetical protein VNM40_04525 [Candidatus Paceibacterota bacterium]|nr:hypothetical protein [Candidatus Paceibacterota bacterium]
MEADIISAWEMYAIAWGGPLIGALITMVWAHISGSSQIARLRRERVTGPEMLYWRHWDSTTVH